MKLTPMSTEVFEYVKKNGGRVVLNEMADEIGRSPRSVGANVTDLQKKGLVVRENVTDDDDNKTTYVILTEAGEEFVPSDDDE